LYFGETHVNPPCTPPPSMVGVWFKPNLKSTLFSYNLPKLLGPYTFVSTSTPNWLTGICPEGDTISNGSEVLLPI